MFVLIELLFCLSFLDNFLTPKQLVSDFRKGTAMAKFERVVHAHPVWGLG